MCWHRNKRYPVNAIDILMIVILVLTIIYILKEEFFK
jgi:hypothetical protein